MKYLRWALGVLIGFYALISLLPLGSTVLFKLGKLDAAAAEMQRYVPLMNEMAPWHLVLWLVGVVLYLVAVWRLFRGGQALMAYLAAFVLDVVSLYVMRGGQAYAQVFTADELKMDYYILAALAVGGLLIWLTERAKA